MNKDITQSVLETIEKKQIAPKARVWFIVRNAATWVLGIISLVVGSIAVAVMIFMLRNNDLDIYSHFEHSRAAHIMATLPYLWILLLIAFILCAHYTLRHTEKGYKYSLTSLLGVSILASGILGAGLYAVGVGEQIDKKLSQAPFYSQIANPRHRVWNQPEKGRISGVIIELTSPVTFTLKDGQAHVWYIEKSESPKPLPRGARPPQVALHQGMEVRIIGEQTEQYVFVADYVLPWTPQKSPINMLQRPIKRPQSQSERNTPPRTY